MGAIHIHHHRRAIVEVDDRTLAHLQIVIVAKLRRDEQFTLTWAVDRASGGGTSSVWIGRGVPLRFEYFGGRSPSINRAWLEAILDTANKGDLRIIPEPGAGYPPAEGRTGP